MFNKPIGLEKSKNGVGYIEVDGRLSLVRPKTFRDYFIEISIFPSSTDSGDIDGTIYFKSKKKRLAYISENLYNMQGQNGEHMILVVIPNGVAKGKICNISMQYEGEI